MTPRYWTCPYCGHITWGRFRINTHLAVCPVRMGKKVCPDMSASRPKIRKG